MKKPKNKIVFNGIVSSVRTLADFGIRVSFDLPEDAVKQAAQLMQARTDGITLRVEVMAETNEVQNEKS